jgi:hypothetical protein
MDVIIMFIGIITLVTNVDTTGNVTSYDVYLPHGSTTVAMCKASVPPHTAFIRVRDWKPSDVATDWSPIPCADGSSTDCRLFPLEGDEITIVGITDAGSPTAGTGLKQIPRLRDEYGVQKITPALARAKSAAYLTLKNGTLSGTRFPKSHNEMRFTKLNTTITATSLVVKGTRKDKDGNTLTRMLTFKGSAAFDFMNLPSDMATNGPATHVGPTDKSHFYLHYKLADKDMENENCKNPADTVIAILETHGRGARSMEDELRPDAATVACSNTIWP